MTNFNTQSESFYIKEKFSYMVDAGYGNKGRAFIRNCSRNNITIDCFVISHGHRDHIGLAKEVIDVFNPRVIVIAPLVYSLQSYRYIVDQLISYPSRKYLPNELLAGSSDKYEQIISKEELDYKNKDEFLTKEVPSIYYVKRSALSTLPFPWRSQLSGTNLPEFEVFPTNNCLYWASLINDFVAIIRNQNLSETLLNSINNSRLIQILATKGYILPQNTNDFLHLFRLIEKYLIKAIDNSQSLICRIGRMVFTGDATAEQLNFIMPILNNQRKLLNNRMVLKINHHGSISEKYINDNFYRNLNPAKLVLKRHCRVATRLNINQFDHRINNLSTVTGARLIDSGALSSGRIGIPFLI